MTQFGALAKLLPRTDVFHFYFGLTLVPPSLQFPILRAARKKSVFHYLGSDIRGKRPEELRDGKRAGAEIVGSYAALRWVPEAHVVPPGLRLGDYTPVPPSDNPRPLVVHAPSNREKKGTRYVIEACERLPVDLDIVEGVRHDEARERYARADIVVDQLNAGWHGVFALEAMALGKPVVAHLDPRDGRAERRGLRRPRPDRPRDEGHPGGCASPARRERGPPPRDRRREQGLCRAGSRHRPHSRPPARDLRCAVSGHSASSSTPCPAANRRMPQVAPYLPVRSPWRSTASAAASIRLGGISPA